MGRLKRLVKVWGARVLVVALIAGGIRAWALPLHRQYFTKKHVEAFVPTARAKAGKFVVSFHEIGAVEAERSISISTQVGGKDNKAGAGGQHSERRPGVDRAGHHGTGA